MRTRGEAGNVTPKEVPLHGKERWRISARLTLLIEFLYIIEFKA